MDTKLSYLIDNMKNVNPAIIFKAMHVIKEKISNVEHKTSVEVEKVVSKFVNKLLEGNSPEAVTEEVRNEIVHKLTGFNNGKNIIPIFKYMNTIILTNAPKNIHTVKNFKKNIASSLIKDAKRRLELNK